MENAPGGIMRFSSGLIGFSFVCSTAGFTLMPPFLSPSLRRPCSRTVWAMTPTAAAAAAVTSKTTTRATVGPSCARFSTRCLVLTTRARTFRTTVCLAAEAGDQLQEMATEEATKTSPRLKRVRKRRKDSSAVATAPEDQEEHDGSDDVIQEGELPVGRLVDPIVSAAATAVVEEVVVPQAKEAVEAVTEAVEGVAAPFRSSGGTKGTKVRVTDSDNDMTEKVAGVASAASEAAGSAVSAVSQAAKAAMGSAMSLLGQGPPEIPAEYDDYVSTFQGAKRVSDDRPAGPDLTDLGKDIARFRAREAKRDAVGGGESFAVAAKGVISTIITIDFFVVIAFMLWFIAGVAGTYAFDDTFLLDRFNEAWSPIVQPALGVLMGGTIAGGVVSKLGESEDDEGSDR